WSCNCNFRSSGNIFEQGSTKMIGGYIDGRRIERENLSQPAFLFGNTGKALELLSIDDSEIESGLGGVIEENGVDDLTSSGGQPEADIEDLEDGFDVRDLLLDETD